jgi:hypothetical protein
VLEQQVAFKGAFYGYGNAVPGWQALQQAASLPVNASQYLPWLRPEPRFLETMVDTPEAWARYRQGGQPLSCMLPWPTPAERLERNVSPREGEPGRVHIALDMVALQIEPRGGIVRVWRSVLPSLLAELMNARRRVRLTFFQRGTPLDEGWVRELQSWLSEARSLSAVDLEVLRIAPYIPGPSDEIMLASLCRQLHVQVFLSTLYSRPHPSFTTPALRQVLLLHDLTPERLGWDMSEVRP